jgi:hypothetical protein
MILKTPAIRSQERSFLGQLYIVIVVMVIMVNRFNLASFALTKYLKKMNWQRALSLVQEKADDPEHPFSKYS